MKALITGGTGFIGSRLAMKCLERGDRVVVLGQANNPAEEKRAAFVEEQGAELVLASVGDRDRLFEVCKGIDYVFHLAAAQHEANVPDQRFWDVNVEGTKNLLDASTAAGVKRFVHGSTIGVYGSAVDGELNEDSPLNPDNIYGITKLEAEKMVVSRRETLDVVVIRISETYGPGDYRLLKLFKAIKKRAFFMIGKGNNLHHLIYVDDLIQGMFRAATEETAIGNVFVLAGMKPLTTNEMVRIIGQQLGAKLRAFRAPLLPFLLLATVMELTLRPIGIQPPLHRRRMDFFKKSFFFAQNRSQQLLGFQPQMSFEKGVSETMAWYAEMGYL
ncbi:MAG: NAD(P)-dependent oxidoreductase [Nitrospirae bacterium]|nr:NAD(P)-dependent oxidoreductase [Nitrospirota bacterium]